MTQQLKGKKAIITGAGRGIGRAIARTFARQGARVWATSRSMSPMKDMTAMEGIRTLQLDVTSPEAVRQAVEIVGSVEVLVNCAGTVATGTIRECTPEALDYSLDVNLRGAVYMIQAFLDPMIDAGGGSIINVASVLSSISAAPQRFAYGTSKAALIGLTKSVAIDFAAEAIRCNAVCPGAVLTHGLKQRISQSRNPDAALKAFVDRHPVGRLGDPAEIAGACVYLASDQGRFMTGQVLVIDGGMTL